MIAFSIILLSFIIGNDSSEISSPDKLLNLARNGLEYNQDMYALARLRYIVRKYPKSEYANEAFKELYYYYRNEGEFTNAFIVLEEFQTQCFNDPFIAGKLDEIAWLYFKSGDYQGTLRIYHKLSSDYPESEYAKGNEELISHIENVTMCSSSVLGNFLWKIRLDLYFSLYKFGIPFEISQEFFFFLLNVFIFLFIMMLSYILFLSNKQNQHQVFWHSNDSSFVSLFSFRFAFFVIFYFIGRIFLGDNIGGFPRFFQFLPLSALAFFLFRKNIPDFKNYFRLNLTKLRKSLVTLFVGFIAICILLVILESIYSKTSAAIVSRGLKGNIRISLAPPLTIYRFFIVVLFAPIVEEIMCRGLLYESLKKKTNIVYGILFSSLFYAFIHEFTNITFFYFFSLGIIFALIFEKTRSLTLVMLSHSLLGIFSLLRYLNN